MPISGCADTTMNMYHIYEGYRMLPGRVSVFALWVFTHVWPGTIPTAARIGTYVDVLEVCLPNITNENFSSMYLLNTVIGKLKAVTENASLDPSSRKTAEPHFSASLISYRCQVL